MYKVTQLQIENARKIKALDITPKATGVVVYGKNEQGKSTLLDSLASALTPNIQIPEGFINKDAETSEINISLGEYKIRRVIKRGGKQNVLEIRNAEDNKKTNISATKFLADITSKKDKKQPIALDIAKIVSLDNKSRASILLATSGIDEEKLNKLNTDYKTEYDNRRDVRKDIKKLEDKLCGYDDIKNIDETKLADPADILNDMESISKKIKAKEEIRNSIMNKKAEIARLEKEIAEFGCEKKIAEEVTELTEKGKQKRKGYDEAKENTDKIIKKKEYSNLLRNIGKEKEAMDNVLKKLEKIQSEKNSILEKAKYPVRGMKIDDGEIFIDGIHFDQLSESKRMKIALAIAKKMNPKLRVLIIRNGNAFDKDSLKQIFAWASKNDFQIWIEKVADMPDTDDSAIYLEEGAVLSDEEKKKKLQSICT